MKKLWKKQSMAAVLMLPYNKKSHNSIIFRMLYLCPLGEKIIPVRSRSFTLCQKIAIKLRKLKACLI